MSGPARGRRGRATVLRALLPCLALIPRSIAGRPAHAQTLTPDLFRPARDGFVLAAGFAAAPDRAADNARSRTGDAANDARLRDKDTPAPSRIGQIPTYGLPAASGASDSGFDSLNRKRKKPKLYPGQAKPKPPPGPGSPPPRRPSRRTAACACRSRRRRPPTRRRCRRRWPARWSASRRASG